MMVEISAKFFGGIIGTSMGLFETGFRIFKSAMIISESAVDLGYLISQTEVLVKTSFDFIFRKVEKYSTYAWKDEKIDSGREYLAVREMILLKINFEK